MPAEKTLNIQSLKKWDAKLNINFYFLINLIIWM